LRIRRLPTGDARRVPLRLRGRNARRGNQSHCGNDGGDLTSHVDLHFNFLKIAGPLKRPDRTDAFAFGSRVNMWVKLRFDIGSNAKDLFDSAEQSARHAPDPDAVCLALRFWKT
jgi:hypothetical protein